MMKIVQFFFLDVGSGHVLFVFKVCKIDEDLIFIPKGVERDSFEVI